MARASQNDRDRRGGGEAHHASSEAASIGSEATHVAANSFESLFEAGNKILENWRMVSEEMLEFGKTRLTRNLEATQRVARSNSLDQAIEAQADFARSMMQDYISEMGKLADLSTRALFGSLSALQSERRHLQRGMEAAASHAERSADRMAAE